MKTLKLALLGLIFSLPAQADITLEYIELAEFDVPGLIRQRTHNERRLSNRANIDSLEVSRLLKRDILKLWRRIKTVRCELVNISFTGIGIKSKELIKIGETVEIALRCPVSQAEQILPVRICNHYREESGNYAYGGKLEHLLDANFIDDGDKIWLIDFDYAGFNSPLFDLSNLASNSELSPEQEKAMLESYFEVTPNRATLKSYHAMKCASLLRETLWSMVSEIYSRVEMDFADYTAKNLARFEAVYAEYRENYS